MISMYSKVILEKLELLKIICKNFLWKYSVSMLKNMRIQQISICRYFFAYFYMENTYFSWKYCILKIVKFHDFEVEFLARSPHPVMWCDVVKISFFVFSDHDEFIEPIQSFWTKILVKFWSFKLFHVTYFQFFILKWPKSNI